MNETRKQIVERQQDLKDKILLDFNADEELVKGIEKDEFDRKYKGKTMFTAESLSLFTLAVSKAIGEDKEHEKEILEKAKKDFEQLEKKKVLLGEGDWMYMWVSKSIATEDGDIEKGKKAGVGEIRVWSGGVKMMKQADGSWKELSTEQKMLHLHEDDDEKKEGEKPEKKKEEEKPKGKGFDQLITSLAKDQLVNIANDKNINIDGFSRNEMEEEILANLSDKDKKNYFDLYGD